MPLCNHGTAVLNQSSVCVCVASLHLTKMSIFKMLQKDSIWRAAALEYHTAAMQHTFNAPHQQLDYQTNTFPTKETNGARRNHCATLLSLWEAVNGLIQ